MLRLWRFWLRFLKWLVLTAVAVEVFCFLLVTASNYLIYSHAREGSRVRYDPYAFFLNEEGPRPTVHNPTGAEGGRVHTVWMFGGSTMRGSVRRDDETIPSYLAAALNRPGSPYPWKVMNFGENSFNSLLETKYLQKLLIESPTLPDLIIFYDGANDCSYFAEYRTPYAHYGYRRLRAAVESYRGSFFGLLKPLNAAIYTSSTKELYDKLREVAVPLNPASPNLQEMVVLTARRYDHACKLAGCYGARFLLIWQPILWVETGKVAPQVQAQEQKYTIEGARFLSVRHNFSVVYQALLGGLQDKPYFISFQNLLCPRSRPVYEPDGVHLKAAGDEMVARELARVLQERLK